MFVSTTTNETDVGCIRACSVPPEERGHSFITNGLEAPLTWVTLEDLSGDTDGYTFEMEGRVRPD